MQMMTMEMMSLDQQSSNVRNVRRHDRNVAGFNMVLPVCIARDIFNNEPLLCDLLTLYNYSMECLAL